MYHDQGLAPLKALYFDESINASVVGALDILREITGRQLPTASVVSHTFAANPLS